MDNKKVYHSHFNKAKSGDAHDIDCAEFFINEGILSAGWSKIESEKKMTTIEEYKEAFLKQYSSINWNKQGVHYLFENVQKGDYVWITNRGVYYVAEITKSPEDSFKFDNSKEFLKYDSAPHIEGLEWIRVGTEECVPGSVSTAKGRLRSTIQKIDNGDELTGDNDKKQYTTTSFYAKHLINREKKFYDNPEPPEINRDKIFSFLDPSSLEDLVAMFLFNKYGYIVIPSTNKISTQSYEYVMIDPKSDSGKKIYVQTKNGAVDITSNNYQELVLENRENEVWLLTTRGRIDKVKNNHFVKMTAEGLEEFQLTQLVDFLFNERNTHVIPPYIKKWIEMFHWR